MGSLSLLQGIFPTEQLNPGLPHYRWTFYQLSHKGRWEFLLSHFYMILRSILYFISSCCCSVAKLCLTLCNPLDCSPPGSSVLSSRILKWVAVSFSRGSSLTRDWTCISYIGRQVLSHWAREAPTDFIWHLNAIDLTMTIYVYEVKWNEVTQSCLTLCYPMDCSLTGSSVHGVLQARVLE